MLFQRITAELTFEEAHKLWFAHRSVGNGAAGQPVCYLRPKSMKDLKDCAVALGRFFNGLKLGEIHAGHLMQYQQARAINDQSVAQWTRPAGAQRIRKEIAFLIRLLTLAGAWADAEKLHFQPLRVEEKDVNRAMTPEEQHRFLHMASSRDRWHVVYWYATLALQTTASTNELRGLRLGDLFLREGYIQIRKANAKNKYRIRTIPLVSEEAHYALEKLMERARGLGASAPYHYLFPIREKRGVWNPAKPMSETGLKKPWEEVRSAAGLSWLRMYDLRHTGLTRMAEAGTPIHVMLGHAGHIDFKTQQHYVTVALQSKTAWLRATWAGGAKPPQEPDPRERFGPRSVPPAARKQAAS